MHGLLGGGGFTPSPPLASALASALDISMRSQNDSFQRLRQGNGNTAPMAVQVLIINSFGPDNHSLILFSSVQL